MNPTAEPVCFPLNALIQPALGLSRFANVQTTPVVLLPGDSALLLPSRWGQSQLQVWPWGSGTEQSLGHQGHLCPRWDTGWSRLCRGRAVPALFPAGPGPWEAGSEPAVLWQPGGTFLSWGTQGKGGIVPLCSALGRPHLQSWGKFGAPQIRKTLNY